MNLYGSLIKSYQYSDDTSFIRNRVKRALSLREFVPNVTSSSEHMYVYNKAPGATLSSAINPPLFSKFLDFCSSFWEPSPLSDQEQIDFTTQCNHFYYHKTLKRVKLFFDTHDFDDEPGTINGDFVPALSNLLSNVNWELLANGYPGRFHGDFHFENILWDSQLAKFILLDWRQDFAGNTINGDIYYDLAKLLHGFIVSHDMVSGNHFSVSRINTDFEYSFLRKNILVECESVFYDWCVLNGFDVSKVKILCSLVFLNIAALHHSPYDLFLFALGKHSLYRSLSNS